MAKVLMDKVVSKSNCILSISNTRTMASCSTFCPPLPTRFSTSSLSPKPQFFVSFKAFSSQTPKGTLFLPFRVLFLSGHSLFPIWGIVRTMRTTIAQSRFYLYVNWSVGFNNCYPVIKHLLDFGKCIIP